MSPEDLTKKSGEHDAKIQVLSYFHIIVMVLAIVACFLPRPTKSLIVVHPNATDSLRVEIAALRDSLQSVKAQGVPAVLQKIQEETAYDARLSDETRALVTQLEERLNRLELRK